MRGLNNIDVGGDAAGEEGGGNERKKGMILRERNEYEGILPVTSYTPASIIIHNPSLDSLSCVATSLVVNSLDIFDCLYGLSIAISSSMRIVGSSIYECGWEVISCGLRGLQGWGRGGVREGRWSWRYRLTVLGRIGGRMGDM
jgi:hypothetical protein